MQNHETDQLPDRPTWIEISAAAIANNLAQLRRIIGPDVLLTAVVKANAYGHCAALVGPLAEQQGADRFAVAALSEASELRRCGVQAPILTLGYTPPRLATEAIRNDVQLTVFDLDSARQFHAAAASQGRRLTVHVKVNTGMNRLGVNPPDAPALMQALAMLDGLHVEGIFTHFASSDLADKRVAAAQFARFQTLLDDLAALGLRPPLAHAANSAAILTMPETHLDMVRAGIAIYGLDPDVDETKIPAAFTPALTWKAEIGQVRALAPGDGVSYGHEFVAARPMHVAVIPVGYADGFPRRPRTWESVLVRGQAAPIVGRVCMDQTVIDVTAMMTAAHPVRAGEEVVLIGAQGDAVLSAAEAGLRTGTINYDVTSRILSRVPRLLIPAAAMDRAESRP